MNAAGSKVLATTLDAGHALQTALAKVGLKAIARVKVSQRVTDLGIALSLTRLAVVRYVDRSTPEDKVALATMIAEGDFVWAGLVYGGDEGVPPVDRIETFHISELDRLVARLRELGAPPDEAR